MKLGLRTSTELAIILGRQPSAVAQFGQNLPARLAESTGTVFYCGGSGANDANAGTNPAAPWATAQHAVDTLTSNQICRFRTGTYTGINIYHKRNTQTITLEADSGQLPIFKGKSPGSNNIVDFWDSQFYRIRNIELDGHDNAGSGPAAGGIGCTGSSASSEVCNNFEAYGCNIHDMSMVNHGTLGQAGLGTGGDMPTKIAFYNCRIWRVGRRAVTTSQIVSGATTIPVDQVLDVPASGQVWLPDHSRASFTGTSGGNTLTGVTGITATWATGTVLFGVGVGPTLFELDHGSYIGQTGNVNSPDVLFGNCIFHDNIGCGAQVYPTPDHTWYVNCTLAYNFNGSGMNYAQDSANQCTGNYFVNCISYHNDDAGQFTNHPSGYDIFYMTAGDTPINHIDSCIGYWNGGAATGFNFVGDNAGVVHSNKIESDPLFISNGTDASNRNFDLNASGPCINTGVASYMPSFDYTGATRTRADIGAYLGS